MARIKREILTRREVVHHFARAISSCFVKKMLSKMSAKRKLTQHFYTDFPSVSLPRGGGGGGGGEEAGLVCVFSARKAKHLDVTTMFTSGLSWLI